MTEERSAQLERTTPIRRLDPDDAVTQAKKWADALMRVVKDTRISVNISGREYLKVEAWQTLARFNYCWIDTEWTHDIKDDEGRVLGVEARARLMSLDTGQSLGGAEGACMMDEAVETREGQSIERWSAYYAVKSMAQTRAQGKVGRMAYAWVAVLAGYESTPAEEMLDVNRQGPERCPVCQKPSTIIKGRPEYGGGWLCFKKKGGCGAKWTDEEWEAIASAKDPSTYPEDTSETRDILLGRIKGVSDVLQLPASQQAELWIKHCRSGTTPENAEIAGLTSLYEELVNLRGRRR